MYLFQLKMFELTSDWQLRQPYCCIWQTNQPPMLHFNISTFWNQRKMFCKCIICPKCAEAAKCKLYCNDFKLKSKINFLKRFLIQLHISTFPFLPSLSPRCLQRCLEGGIRVALAASRQPFHQAPRTRQRGRGGRPPRGAPRRRRGW